MRFIIFVIDGPGNPANADEMKHIDAFNEKLQENGRWVMAAGIQQAAGATLIDNRNNKNEITSGSLFTGPDSYSGFWIIEAESEAVAKQLAAEGSWACNRKVELRPYLR
ncbi:MAG: hypothetical protein RLZZ194_16 [Actinomycetota bacterium]